MGCQRVTLTPARSAAARRSAAVPTPHSSTTPGGTFWREMETPPSCGAAPSPKPSPGCLAARDILLADYPKAILEAMGVPDTAGTHGASSLRGVLRRSKGLRSGKGRAARARGRRESLPALKLDGGCAPRPRVVACTLRNSLGRNRCTCRPCRLQPSWSVCSTLGAGRTPQAQTQAGSMRPREHRTEVRNSVLRPKPAAMGNGLTQRVIPRTAEPAEPSAQQRQESSANARNVFACLKLIRNSALIHVLGSRGLTIAEHRESSSLAVQSR